MNSTKKTLPPKVSGLIKQGVIDAAPETAAQASMPVLPNMPLIVEPAAGEAVEATVLPATQAESVKLIPLDLIDASRFQNRLTINEEKVLSLAENIRKDGLNNPIIVRSVGARYELVAGETRMRAFRHLGYQEIPAFVREMDDSHSARSTVLDNFFHESLTDFEIYKGLQILMDVAAASSIRTLADITPWEKSHVQRLMAFGRLPPGAIRILEGQPGLLGGATAEALAACKGKGVTDDLVVKAVERIRDQKMPQNQAMAWIESKGRDRSANAATPARAIVTSGRGDAICTVDRGPKGIKIQGAKGVAIDWEPIQLALIELLKRQLTPDE